MNDVEQAYNNWADQYDTNNNKTRDLEAVALKTSLSGMFFDNCLEIGCGTGKNTEWLVDHANNILAIDLSNEMLKKAREKIVSKKVWFQQANVLSTWTFGTDLYNLVTFSLVLEHIENLDPVFAEVANALAPGGYVYIGELHPFKQYSGSKAKFDTEARTQVVTCFNHHISDFTQAAKRHGLSLVDLKEYFDDNDRSQIPRIMTVLLQK
ncbi:MAG: class I SAM-dependent methyltransferase [Bacteroidota bacterium]|nr:class I SAM-dependent methyltransferase [Bacteroidota bacterium]